MDAVKEVLVKLRGKNGMLAIKYEIIAVYIFFVVVPILSQG